MQFELGSTAAPHPPGCEAVEADQQGHRITAEVCNFGMLVDALEQEKTYHGKTNEILEKKGWFRAEMVARF